MTASYPSGTGEPVWTFENDVISTGSASVAAYATGSGWTAQRALPRRVALRHSRPPCSSVPIRTWKRSAYSGTRRPNAGESRSIGRTSAADSPSITVSPSGTGCTGSAIAAVYSPNGKPSIARPLLAGPLTLVPSQTRPPKLAEPHTMATHTGTRFR